MNLLVYSTKMDILVIKLECNFYTIAAKVLEMLYRLWNENSENFCRLIWVEICNENVNFSVRENL